MWLLDTLSRWPCPSMTEKVEAPTSTPLPPNPPTSHSGCASSTVQQTEGVFPRPSFLNLHAGLHSRVLCLLLIVILLFLKCPDFSRPHSLGSFLPPVCPCLLSASVSRLHPASAILFLDSLTVSIMYSNIFFPLSPILLCFHHLLPWLSIFFISIFNPCLPAEK